MKGAYRRHFALIVDVYDQNQNQKFSILAFLVHDYFTFSLPTANPLMIYKCSGNIPLKLRYESLLLMSYVSVCTLVFTSMKTTNTEKYIFCLCPFSVEGCGDNIVPSKGISYYWEVLTSRFPAAFIWQMSYMTSRCSFFNFAWFYLHPHEQEASCQHTDILHMSRDYPVGKYSVWVAE